MRASEGVERGWKEGARGGREVATVIGAGEAARRNTAREGEIGRDGRGGESQREVEDRQTEEERGWGGTEVGGERERKSWQMIRISMRPTPCPKGQKIN